VARSARLLSLSERLAPCECSATARSHRISGAGDGFAYERDRQFAAAADDSAGEEALTSRPPW
jgi:hypothetical protein